MRIAIRRTAVRSPARMADTHGSLRHIVLDLVAQRRKAADTLLDANVIAVIDRNASRIIAAVLELRKTLEQEIRSLLVTDITYNTTHDTYLLVVLQQVPRAAFVMRIAPHLSAGRIDWDGRKASADVSTTFSSFSPLSFQAHLGELALRIASFP